jgi:hypothetical protein
MCNPSNSNLIEKEYIEIGFHDPNQNFEYTNFNFIKFDNLYKLYVAGGEPTAMPDLYNFLQTCIDTNNTDFEFVINTNAVKISNKLKELGVLQENEAQPSIATTYPGQAASGSISPALLAVEGCPESTQNIALNIANRQKAIDEAHYGPLSPNEPNEEYWKAKANQFGASVEEAKKALCGNCSFFYRTPEILKCIAEGLGEEVDPYEAIDAGEIGYCEAYDFKCAASRTCDAWVVGGPITK